MRVVARHCRICGAEMIVEDYRGEMGEARKRGTEMLRQHLEGHTREQIVRVYVLGEPWWEVVRDEAPVAPRGKDAIGA